MKCSPIRLAAAVLALVGLLGIALPKPLQALESDWSAVGNSARARLVAGTVEKAGSSHLYAFVDIEMADGWKTYWRNPGDAGGLPPVFDLAASGNVTSVSVLFPAPKRLVDKSGNTLGYKGHVVFPIEIVATEADKAVTLRLDARYGLCKDICIPAEASFELEVPTGSIALSDAALAALAHVPRDASVAGPDDPVLAAVKPDLASSKPKIVLETTFSGDGKGADVFLEAPDSLYIPVPVKTGGSGGSLTFEVDLSDGVDLAALKGKTLTATLVSDAGQSAATFKVD